MWSLNGTPCPLPDSVICNDGTCTNNISIALLMDGVTGLMPVEMVLVIVFLSFLLSLQEMVVNVLKLSMKLVLLLVLRMIVLITRLNGQIVLSSVALVRAIVFRL